MSVCVSSPLHTWTTLWTLSSHSKAPECLSTKSNPADIKGRGDCPESMCVKASSSLSCPLTVLSLSLVPPYSLLTSAQGGPLLDAAGHRRRWSHSSWSLCFLHFLLFYLLPLKTLKVLLLEPDTENCRLVKLGLHCSEQDWYCACILHWYHYTSYCMSRYSPLLWDILFCYLTTELDFFMMRAGLLNVAHFFVILRKKHYAGHDLTKSLQDSLCELFSVKLKLWKLCELCLEVI